MFEYILKSRVKYVALGIVGLFCLILFLTSSGDHSIEEEQLGLIQYKKNLISEQAENFRKQRSAPGPNSKDDTIPADFQVQFLSGKELANEVDNEHKSFQVHRVKLTNMEKSKVSIECQDPFSSFGKMLAPGASFEFRVTDLFAKRHYWCSAKYGASEYIFRAYGEGAPRDNNVISLHKDGAFINGKNHIIEDSPMRFKHPKPLGLKESANDGDGYIG